MIARASIGAGTDPRYAAHARDTLADGRVLGAYHFATYGPGPTRQAETFLRAVGDTADFLAIDDEAGALGHPATVRSIILNIRRLDPHHRPILLYSSDGTWPGDLGQDGNWVARWGTAEPHRPWLFWQYTTSAGRLDRDVFHGDVAQLRAWIHRRVS